MTKLGQDVRSKGTLPYQCINVTICICLNLKPLKAWTGRQLVSSICTVKNNFKITQSEKWFDRYCNILFVQNITENRKIADHELIIKICLCLSLCLLTSCNQCVLYSYDRYVSLSYRNSSHTHIPHHNGPWNTFSYKTTNYGYYLIQSTLIFNDHLARVRDGVIE